MEALDGILHLDEGVAQLTGQGLGLPTLGVDLARVGEVGVVVEAAIGPEAELGELSSQVRLLVGQHDLELCSVDL